MLFRSIQHELISNARIILSARPSRHLRADVNFPDEIVFRSCGRYLCVVVFPHVESQNICRPVVLEELYIQGTHCTGADHGDMQLPDAFRVFCNRGCQFRLFGDVMQRFNQQLPISERQRPRPFAQDDFQFVFLFAVLRHMKLAHAACFRGWTR